MPARSVCLVTLSLSEAGPGRFGRQASVTDIYHAMPCQGVLNPTMLTRQCYPQSHTDHQTRPTTTTKTRPKNPRRWCACKCACVCVRESGGPI